jgi:hypothetical protein
VTESMRMWVEISFNIAYLVVVWGLVVAMLRRQHGVPAAARRVTGLFIWAFGLLALGDTGHVGFRVWAYALGSLEETVTLLGSRVGLVGLGALSTAVTVTFFYVLVLFIWQRRFDRPLGRFGILLLAMAVVRLVIMAFPQNEWNSSVPPQAWSMARNGPLLIQGLGAAYLILRDAIAARDRTFTWVGCMILVSYGFYLPVILFVQRVPVLGMLMIPKTVAYVVIGWLAYANLFVRPSRKD